MDKRIVITGIGSVSSIGNNISEYLNGLQNKTNGIKKTFFENDKTPYFIGKVKLSNDEIIEKILKNNFFLNSRKKDLIRVIGRSGLMAILSSNEAIKMSNLNVDKNNNYCINFGFGNNQGDNDVEVTLDHINGKYGPFNILKSIPDTITGLLAEKYGFHGTNEVNVTACSSGMTSMRNSINSILIGDTNLVLVGGSDNSTIERDFKNFYKMKAISKKGISIPLDKNSDGFVMGEGSGSLIIENFENAIKRGANILAEIIGYGATSDAYGMVKPEPTSFQYIRAVNQAFKKANICHQKIDVLNIHGTSTPDNNQQELNLYNHIKAKGGNPRITAIKSQMGHTIGASGILSTIASVLMMNNDFIPDILNLNNPLTNFYSENKLNTFHLITAAGFGGHNEALILKKYT